MKKRHPLPPMAPPYRLLFVCLGNICRSPAAEGIFRSVVERREGAVGAEWEIDSAGLYGGHAGDLPDSRMRSHALRRGYTLAHRARQMKPADFARYDLIIGMDAANISALRRMAPTVEDEAKIHSMVEFVADTRGYDHVPDPYYEGAEGFELVLDLLEDGCANLYDMLRKTSPTI